MLFWIEKLWLIEASYILFNLSNDSEEASDEQTRH